MMGKFLNTIAYNLLDIWDINRILQDNEYEDMVPLSSLLTQYQKIISKQEAIAKHLFIISKISFAGVLHLNDFEKIYSVKGTLYEIPIGAITYSKINVRHGCSYLNNTNNSILASSEYPSFIIDENKVYPKYLIMVLRCPQILKQFNSKLRGFTKSRVGVSEFLLTKIPLPSLEKQKELVAEYEKLQNLATQKEEDAKKIENSIDEYLLSELGVKNVSSLRNERNLFKVIQYNALNKWEIDRIYQLEAKYPIVSFGNNPNIVQSIKRGKSPHYSEQSNCLAINQKCVRKQYIDMTYAKKIEQIWCDEIDTEYKTKEDDILINSTGEGTIGRAAIVNKETNYIYDSNILNVRLNKEECFPHYFLRLFNTELLQKQVHLYKSGTSTKHTELGVDNLKKISFPLPSMEIQRSIIMEIENKEKQIIILRNESEQLKQQAVSNFEQEVFN